MIWPEPTSEFSDEAFRAAYAFPARQPWVRGSMVSTLDGAMRGADGLSGSISSAADRRVFSWLREAADVLLVGAGSIRDEGYRPSRTPMAVVTASLDLPPDLPLFAQRTADTPRTIVLTTARAADRCPAYLREHADVVACGDEAVDLAAAVDELKGRGLGHVHCEGGPRLLGSLASAGVLDEVLLTVTPLLHGGGRDDRILAVRGGLQPPQRLRIAQILEEDGSLFLRAGRP